jgi:hypothetical protein
MPKFHSALDLTTDLAVEHGGTGLSTVGTNEILTGNGTGALTSEANLTFTSDRLIIGADDEITPQLRLRNDANTVTVAIADSTDNVVSGSVDGDFILDCSGDNNVLFTQNNTVAAKIDTNGDFNLNRKFTVSASGSINGDGDVVYIGTGSTVAGEIVHYTSIGTWEAADATDVAKCDGLLGVALGGNPAVNGVLLRGMVTIGSIDGTNAVGAVLFLSEDATGHAKAGLAPSDTNEVVRIIGYCLHATDKTIWFNPDNTFVEVA